MLKRRALLLAKYSVSVGLIALILLRADLDGFLAAIKEVNVLGFIVALLITVLNLLGRSYKWQLLLKVQGARMSVLTAQNLSYMALFFNNFFLGTIGGDAFRAYRVTGYSNSRVGATSSIIMERATGLLGGLVIVLAVGIVYAFTSQTLITAPQLGGLLLLSFIVGLAVFVLFKAHSKLIGLTVWQKHPKLTQLSEDLMSSIRVYQSYKTTMIMALALSLLYHVGNSLTLYFVAVAANAEGAFIPLLFISSLVALLTMIPISVNGLGLQESSFVFYLRQLGVAGPAALLVALLYRAIALILSLVGGLLFITDSVRIRQSPILTEQQKSVL